MSPLTLPNVKLNHKRVITDCLEFYINDIHHLRMQKLEKLLEAIAQRLYYRFFGLVNKPNPPEKSTVKLPYDEGYILYMAINRYQEIGSPSDLAHAILEQYKFSLDKQLI